jgi:uncharacterized protein YggE
LHRDYVIPKEKHIKEGKVKNTLLVLIGVVVLALAVAGLSGCGTSRANGEVMTGTGSDAQQGIWTSGEGKVYVTPDVAVLTLGVESQESTVAAAREKAATAMDAIIAAIKAQGIEDKDIQTQYFNIYQTTRWYGDKEEVTGYRVTNTVVVKVRQVEKAGEVIDRAVEAGGDLTRVNGINFTVDEPQTYYEKARDKAFDYAVDKAKQLAAKAGVKLGEVVYMTESSGNNNYGIMYPNYAIFEDAVPIPLPTIPTNISIGQLEISATVSLGYEISR